MLSIRKASLRPVLMPINGLTPVNSERGIPRLRTLSRSRLTDSGSRDHAPALNRLRSTPTPSFAICTLRSSTRNCSLGIAQTRVVSGTIPLSGRRTTMIDGKTSASLKICLAWPKSTTDSTQPFSAKNFRNGSP